jgi:hypothetical protein
MLFMNIYKFKEGKREEIIKQRVEQGHGAPEGTTVLGQWSRLDGSGGIMLFETDKPDYTWTMMWSELLDMEVIPVLDTEKDVMSLLKE